MPESNKYGKEDSLLLCFYSYAGEFRGKMQKPKTHIKKTDNVYDFI